MTIRAIVVVLTMVALLLLVVSRWDLEQTNTGPSIVSIEPDVKAEYRVIDPIQDDDSPLDTAEQAEKPVVDEQSEENTRRRDWAMASLAESLTEGDPRTPELDEVPERARPDAAVLEDRALYRAHQRAQALENVMPFLAGILDIPELEEKIHHARVTGTRSVEDILDAEEALEALYEARELLRRDHPDVYQSLVKASPLSQ